MSEELQQKYLELQMLSGQVKNMQQQFEQVSRQANEMQMMKEALETVAISKKDDEMFASLGPGIFVKAKLCDNKEVLMSTGSGSVVPKSVDDAKKIIEQQLAELGKISDETKQAIEEGMLKLQQIQSELQMLSQKKEK